MTIEEFIAARLAEDQAAARSAVRIWRDDVLDAPDLLGTVGDAAHSHILIHDPARVLRQCAAFQVVLEFWQGLTRLRKIAAIWSDHPDYQEDWAVDA